MTFGSKELQKFSLTLQVYIDIMAFLQKKYILTIILFSIAILGVSQEYLTKIKNLEAVAEDAKAKGLKLKTAGAYDKIAFVLWTNQQHFQAIDYFNKSLQIYKSLPNQRYAVLITYSNIGMLYSEKQNLPNALNNFQRSLDERRRFGNDSLIAAGLVDVSTILFGMKRLNQSIDLLNEALKISSRLNDLPLLRVTCVMLAENYKTLGNKKKYEEYYASYSLYDTQIQAQHIKKKMEKDRTTILKLEEHTKFVEAEKKAKEFELQSQFMKSRKEKDSLAFAQFSKEKQSAIEKLSVQDELNKIKIKEQETKAKQERLFLLGAIFGAFLMLLLAFFAIRGYRIKTRANTMLKEQKVQIEKQRDDIQSKNEEINTAFQKIQQQNLSITQSINYAQRIQSAVLPNPELLTQILPDSFIYLRPRDIVSGDFFFFKFISNNIMFEDKSVMFSPATVSRLVIAAVDCTGHGVPGAFMSMIGFTLLEDIVKRGIIRPNMILNELHHQIRTSLRQDLTDNQDGMDIALCMVDLENKIVEFAGAMNPLVYIQNDTLHHVKPDNKGIGGFQFEKDIKFTHFEIAVNEPTCFYIFSDGYADQFGGEKGKKFYSKRFDELLLRNHKKPFTEQKQLLNQTFEDWIGKKQKQVDDVLVMGFKVG
jgi:serine phosphatase RsbU (regulator of sigma subunit)/tetratricopeptide (TPR) repeat protein